MAPEQKSILVKEIIDLNIFLVDFKCGKRNMVLISTGDNHDICELIVIALLLRCPTYEEINAGGSQEEWPDNRNVPYIDFVSNQ